MLRRIIPILLSLFIISCDNQEKNSSASRSSNSVEKNSPVFRKVEPRNSHITFANTITHDVGSLNNLFDYDYFYNGAGVGMEDLNNDGFLDVFFCGNQVNNSLYFNKGDLTFEDVSDTAQINNGKIWSNGVTFADINNDSWDDLVLANGYFTGTEPDDL